MPSSVENSRVVHLKIDRATFDSHFKQKTVIFNLIESFDLTVRNNKLILGKAISSISKGITFHIFQIETKKEILEFIDNHKKDELFHYFYLIPRPKLYTVILAGEKVCFIIFSEILNTKKIILFNLKELEFTEYLELVQVIKSKFKLIKDDIILLEDKVKSLLLKDALSVNFKFSSNHTSLTNLIWIV
jgi:hypothetical protein